MLAIFKRNSVLLKQTTSKHPYCLTKFQNVIACSSLPFSPKYQCSSVRQNLASDLHQHQQKQSSEETYIQLDLLAQTITKDIVSNSINQHIIKRSLIHLLENKSFSLRQQKLIEVLYRLSFYPKFTVDNKYLLAIYKIVGFNMHLKSVEYLNKVLLFVLVADPNISQSPIYQQFIKFYLQVPLEEWKIKYQIDFDKLSVVGALKQFIARIAQRGFFSRSPSYSRNLNIIYPTEILMKLSLRPETRDSLLLKKLNYTIFMDIKTYYEQQMKENLYHPKKLELMALRYTHDYMRVLSLEIPHLHHQNSHLRELYMKLYMTLPEESDSLIDNKLEKAGMEELKYKNVIFLYDLAEMHIKRLDHLTLEQIKENIGVAIEFVKKVENNFRKMGRRGDFDIRKFSIEEMFRVLCLLQKINLTDQKIYRQIIEVIIERLTPLNLQFYFQSVLYLLKDPKISQLTLKLLQSPDIFSLLSLGQLQTLSSLIHPQVPSSFSQPLYTTILQTLLSTDYKIIGGFQLLQILHIYSRYHLLKDSKTVFDEKTIQNSENLRIFLMRYLADHHKEFKIGELADILAQILDLNEDICYGFDDQDGNYSKSIFQEMEEYLQKVEILFGGEVNRKLKERQAKMKERGG